MILDSSVITALMSLVGTVIGTFAGIVTSGKLTIYRIEQLEKKVSKHNNLVERMVVVEQSVRSAHKRLDEITRDGQ